MKRMYQYCLELFHIFPPSLCLFHFSEKKKTIIRHALIFISVDLTIPVRSLLDVRVRKGNDSSCKNSFFQIRRMSWIIQQGITTLSIILL